MLDCVPKMPLLPVKKKTFSYMYYIILFNFINCPVFIGITQILHYKVAIE